MTDAAAPATVPGKDPKSEKTPVVKVKTNYITLDNRIATESNPRLKYRMSVDWIIGMLPIAATVTQAQAEFCGVDRQTYQRDMGEMDAIRRAFMNRPKATADMPVVEADRGEIDQRIYSITTERGTEPSSAFGEHAPAIASGLSDAARDRASDRGQFTLDNWRLQIKIVLARYGSWDLTTESATEAPNYNQEARQGDWGGFSAGGRAPLAVADPKPVVRALKSVGEPDKGEESEEEEEEPEIIPEYEPDSTTPYRPDG